MIDPGEVEILGPLGRRRFTGLHICEAFEDHEHPWAHLSIVMAGRVSVQMSRVENGVLIDLGTKEYHAGQEFIVPAWTRHVVKVLENGSKWWCLFSHRDSNGIVVEQFSGNMAAYV